MLSEMKYALLTKLRNPSIIFWPFVFPIALATLMYFAIGRMEQADFETVPAALVMEESENGRAFSAFLASLGEGSDLIRVEEMTEEDALEALEKGEVEGIFYAGEETGLTVSGNGFPENILHSVLSSYLSGKSAVEDIARLHPEGMPAAEEKLQQYDTAVEQVSLGGKTLNYPCSRAAGRGRQRTVFLSGTDGIHCLTGGNGQYRRHFHSNLSGRARRCILDVAHGPSRKLVCLY